MIWGVGTGRCGTTSLAKELGGVHEPYKFPMEKLVQYRQDESNKEEILEWLNKVYADGRDAVDVRFSFVISLIVQIDPNAQIIWIYRNPFGTIASWLSRGNWQGEFKSGKGKIRPNPNEEDGGWPAAWSPAMRGGWYWAVMNWMIYLELSRNNISPRMVECGYDLAEHLNQRTDKKEIVFSEREAEQIYIDTQNIWQKMMGLTL